MRDDWHSIIEVESSARSQRGVVNPSATQLFFTPMRLLQQLFDRPYEQHAWIYSAVSYLATNLAQVPWRIYKGHPDAAHSPAETGPWVDLFKNPNPHLVDFQLWEATCIWLLLSGECAWVKEGRSGRVQQGEVPTELWPMDGKTLSLVINDKTKLIDWYVLRTQAGTIFLAPHEVVHFKFYNPYDPLRGLAPLSAAISAARQDHKASRYNEAFFDNDATPGGVLVSAQELTPEARKDIQQAWEDRHKGYDRGRRVAILEGGLDWKPSGATQKDMEFVAQRGWSREEVLAVFGVPLSELLGEEGAGLTTGQGVSQRDRNFWTKRVLPKMRLCERVVYKALFGDVNRATPGITQDYFGEFDRSTIPALRDSLSEQLKNAELLSKWYPINVINEKLGLGMPKVEGGDDSPLALPPPEPEAEDEKMPGDEPEEEEKSAMKMGASLIGHRTSSPRRVAAWQRVVRATMDPFEQRFKGKFRRYLMDLRAEQLKRIKQLDIARAAASLRESPMGDLDALAAATRAGIDDALFSEAEWNKKIRSAHHGIYVDITGGALKDVFQELGHPAFALDEADPRVVEIAEAREEILVKANKTIRQQLAREIAAGLKNNEDVAQITDRIRRRFNQLGGPRAQTIARTEVAGTVNASRYLAMKEEGIEQHEWTTAKDEFVRPSHEAQDGQIVVIGAPFENGLRYPNDPAGDAGEVINCRCVVVPVV